MVWIFHKVKEFIYVSPKERKKEKKNTIELINKVLEKNPAAALVAARTNGN